MLVPSSYRAAVKTERGWPQTNSNNTTQKLSFTSCGPSPSLKTIHTNSVLIKQVGATRPNENKTEHGPSQSETASGAADGRATFVVAMNRLDVVDLGVDLFDLDLDVDLVDVDLAVSLCDGPRSVLFSFGLVAPTCFV